MLGGFNIISVINGISDINDNGEKLQRNSFIAHADTDLNLKSVTESSVKLFDVKLNGYVDAYVGYSRRDISIIPKTVQLVPGRTYTIQILSGTNGVKDILGYSLEADIVYDIVFNDKVILKRPVIMSPTANSTVNTVVVELDKADADSCVIEIDDNIKFSSPLYSEEVFEDSFAPTYSFEDKQYYIRAKTKKTFIDEATSENIYAESEYTFPVQFFYETPQDNVPVDNNTAGVVVIKSKPEIDEPLVSDKTIMILTSKDLTAYTVEAKAYSSEIGMSEFYKSDILSFVSAGVLTECTGTLTVAKNLIKFVLDTLEKSTAYYIHVKVTDGTDIIYEDVLSFSTASRTLYIDYEYIKNNVSNFNVDRKYVMDKVQKACDMADYVTVSKIKAENIPFKVKEYVRYKALLDIVVDYQLGYIDMVSGAIGTFQFQLSGANVSSVESAIKQLNTTIKYWETTLKGYEKPGNAEAQFAVRGGDTAPSRTQI